MPAVPVAVAPDQVTFLAGGTFLGDRGALPVGREEVNCQAVLSACSRKFRMFIARNEAFGTGFPTYTQSRKMLPENGCTKPFAT